MRFRWVFLVLLFSLVWAGSGALPWQPAQAQGEVPQPPSSPPVHPQDWSESGLVSPAEALVGPEAALSNVSLSDLTAVLLVGPIDGDYGAWTTQEKNNMELAARELEANGVTVHRFYAPDNSWEQIKTAAQGAHFLFYRGHGVAWSSGSQPVVGGFHLKSGFFSSDAIRRDLKLAPNAIVMMYACYTAGSSGDEVTLSSAEAHRRVAQYSDAFFDLGAAGYYANWHSISFQYFVRFLFQGQTLGQAYESFYDFNPASVERSAHPDHPDLALWLDKDIWGGGTKYDNAFAGRPAESLSSLFGVPVRMEINPNALLTFIEPGSGVQTYSVLVGSTAPQSFTWLASDPSDQPWLEVDPPAGASGTTLQIQLDPGDLEQGTYAAKVQILATTPGVDQPEQDIQITLVLCTPRRLYLPSIGR